MLPIEEKQERPFMDPTQEGISPRIALKVRVQIPGTKEQLLARLTRHHRQANMDMLLDINIPAGKRTGGMRKIQGTKHERIDSSSPAEGCIRSSKHDAAQKGTARWPANAPALEH